MKPIAVFNRCTIAAATALATVLAFSNVSDVSAEGYKQQGTQQQSQSSSQQSVGGALQSQSGSQQSLNQEQVRNAQEKLNKNGYNVGSIDGQWGPQTQSAVRQFQQDEGIQPTGQLDEQTMEKLESASIGTESPSPTMGSSGSDQSG